MMVELVAVDLVLVVVDYNKPTYMTYLYGIPQKLLLSHIFGSKVFSPLGFICSQVVVFGEYVIYILVLNMVKHVCHLYKQ